MFIYYLFFLRHLLVLTFDLQLKSEFCEKLPLDIDEDGTHRKRITPDKGIKYNKIKK